MMSLGAKGLKTKKQLKELIGTPLKGHYIETSLFAEEYPKSGTGQVNIVGPDVYNNRSWYATIILEDHLIKGVK